MNFDFIPNKIESLNQKMMIFTSRAFVIPNYIIFWFLFFANGYYVYDNLRGERDIYKSVPNGAICQDGWRSSSQGPGTCSWHGGVDEYVYSDVYSYTHYPNKEALIVFCEIFLIYILAIPFFSKTSFYIQLINWLIVLQGLLIILMIPFVTIYLVFIVSWVSFSKKKI